ncbi:hypothetical protein [Streptomyces canus]|uniref:hypothetical protein n=1 Tax=Streptomyces canus TaxID=58343 RepID=UPI00386A2B12|nr:hypothetical protein OH824_17990 [Streptomyces canus]
MATTDSFAQSIPAPTLSDEPNIEALLATINALTGRSVMRFASASARTTALTTPVEGMTVWLTAERRLEIYTNGAWTVWPPQAVQTFQVSDAPYNQVQTTVDYSNSAWPRPVFTAPPSGRAFVTISASVSNTNTDTSTIWAAWRATGSLGFTFTNLTRTGLSAQGKRVVASKRTLLTGLTPGETITIIPQWNISSGTSSTAETLSGELLVEPAP